MRSSEEINELAGALCKAQIAMEPAKESGNNPHFKATYATLADVIEAIKVPLGDNGLSYVQLPTEGEMRVGAVTVLMHTSGQWIESETMVPCATPSAHAHGSALTYAKRRGLESMLGLSSASDDDDANVAVAGTQTAAQLAAETAASLRDLIEKGDKVGALQIWMELDQDQQQYFYRNTRYLTSKDKTALREWETAHYQATPEDG